MGYLHIDNLYKNQDVLMFRECYALEKIHGTSAHLSFSVGRDVGLYSGGENYERFCELFDTDKLNGIFSDDIGAEQMTVYGEAYGGKQ